MKIKFKKYLITLFSLFVIFLPMAVHSAALLTNVKVQKIDNSIRILFQLTEPVQQKVFTLSNPNRLVVDFPETKLATHLKNVSFPTAEITSVRSGHPNPTTLRLVFNVASLVHYKISYHNTQVILSISFLTKINSPHERAPVITQNRDIHPLVVVIDAGHGGKDPGASGPSGTKEKDVVLAIAKRLAGIINQHPNMRAVLTRQGDYFVPLRDRLRLARKGKADLFMSIHADSYFDSRSTGASVYALSQRGATSEAARWLASRENYSELGGVDLGELGDKSAVLRSVLIDLVQTATTTDSLRLGNSVLDALDDVTSLHYSRVEQAPFVVLKSPDIPSVLVETGFISNVSEEERLRDKKYQEKIAQALFDGMHIYLKKYSTIG